MGEDDEMWFRPPPSATVAPEEVKRRQIAYRQAYSHIDPRRQDACMLDANPEKPDRDGWLGHRINDGAMLSASGRADDDAIRQYYLGSAATRNVCVVALCVPLVAFVTTRPIAATDELFTTMGHRYWLQTNPTLSEDVSKMAEDVQREADMWQVATDKKHGKHIATLDKLITSLAASLD